jgi:hypothetical protein
LCRRSGWCHCHSSNKTSLGRIATAKLSLIEERNIEVLVYLCHYLSCSKLVFSFRSNLRHTQQILLIFLVTNLMQIMYIETSTTSYLQYSSKTSRTWAPSYRAQQRRSWARWRPRCCPQACTTRRSYSKQQASSRPRCSRSRRSGRWEWPRRIGVQLDVLLAYDFDGTGRGDIPVGQPVSVIQISLPFACATTAS